MFSHRLCLVLGSPGAVGLSPQWPKHSCNKGEISDPSFPIAPVLVVFWGMSSSSLRRVGIDGCVGCWGLGSPLLLTPFVCCYLCLKPGRSDFLRFSPLRPEPLCNERETCSPSLPRALVLPGFVPFGCVCLLNAVCRPWGLTPDRPMTVHRCWATGWIGTMRPYFQPWIGAPHCIFQYVCAIGLTPCARIAYLGLIAIRLSPVFRF